MTQINSTTRMNEKTNGQITQNIISDQNGNLDIQKTHQDDNTYQQDEEENFISENEN
jgi:hypothetical protein